MKPDAVSNRPSLGPTRSGALAQELGKQVTQVLATIAPANASGRRVRDARQDALWDCTGVLQVAGRAPSTDRLVAHLQALPALLEHEREPSFADRLNDWVSETWELIGRR